MNYTNFYKDQEFRYLEIAVCLENSNGLEAKFCIPALTPFVEQDEPYDKLDIEPSKRNILNKNKTNLDIKKCTTSNYITLELPEKNRETGCRKGDKFVVSFIGGDINKPYIIGGYR